MKKQEWWCRIVESNIWENMLFKEAGCLPVWESDFLFVPKDLDGTAWLPFTGKHFICPEKKLSNYFEEFY